MVFHLLYVVFNVKLKLKIKIDLMLVLNKCFARMSFMVGGLACASGAVVMMLFRFNALQFLSLSLCHSRSHSIYHIDIRTSPFSEWPQHAKCV